MVYRITEGLQRLNSIGTVQYLQIHLPRIAENIASVIEENFNSAIENGLYVNGTIVLEQMETGDSFMRTLTGIRRLFQISNQISILEIQAVINIEYKGEAMDIILTYDPNEHDISLISVSQQEDFFKILEYVTFFWMKSRPRI